MQNYLDIDAKTDGAFDPETVRVLIDAFDEAWQSLEKSASSNWPAGASATSGSCAMPPCFIWRKKI